MCLYLYIHYVMPQPIDLAIFFSSLLYFIFYIFAPKWALRDWNCSTSSAAHVSMRYQQFDSSILGTMIPFQDWSKLVKKKEKKKKGWSNWAKSQPNSGLLSMKQLAKLYCVFICEDSLTFHGGTVCPHQGLMLLLGLGLGGWVETVVQSSQ